MEIINFLKKPQDFREKHSFSSAVKTFALVLIADLILAGICALILELPVRFGWISEQSNMLENYIYTIKPAQILLLFVLLVPLLEEFIFRFWLRYEQFYPVTIYNFIKSKIRKIPYREVRTSSKIVWNKFFPLTFYLSTVIFACLHLTNYKTSLAVFLLAPILVLPQFISGFFIGFIRVRLNFIAGYFLHALHNFVFIGIIIFPLMYSGYYSSPLRGESMIIDNNNYYMKIVEVKNYRQFLSKMTITSSVNGDFEVDAKNITLNDLSEADSNFRNQLCCKKNNCSGIDPSTTFGFNLCYRSKNNNVKHADTLIVYTVKYIKAKKKKSVYNY